jgi:hypothetical protein
MSEEPKERRTSHEEKVMRAFSNLSSSFTRLKAGTAGSLEQLRILEEKSEAREREKNARQEDTSKETVVQTRNAGSPRPQ